MNKFKKLYHFLTDNAYIYLTKKQYYIISFIYNGLWFSTLILLAILINSLSVKNIEMQNTINKQQQQIYMLKKQLEVKDESSKRTN
ncbi:hypothetical protein OWM07_03250 [Deferribacter thermophilus]|uniref:hypothetical protein n=1 Tax=Deferribacter thermophilus TaxID=53573 RepID=UPI003C29908F